MALTDTCRQLVEDLLEALPSAATAWSETLEFWDGDVEGDFNALSPFAHHCVERVQDERYAELEPLFEVCERALERQDSYLRSLVVVGLFEGIQNAALHRIGSDSAFEKLLGTESLRAWRELTQGWNRLLGRDTSDN